MGPAVESIALGSVYNTFNDFQLALNNWESKFAHRMRVGSSEILNDSRGVRDEVFKYVAIVLHCVHFGRPNDRGGVRKEPCPNAYGCHAMLCLNFSWNDKLLRITFLNDHHTGHPLATGEAKESVRDSDDEVPLKKARITDPSEPSDHSATTAFRSNEPVAPGMKPRLSLPLTAALAIFNSSKGVLFNKEICTFIQTHFKYYRSVNSGLKIGVRNTLNCHKYFAKNHDKIEDRDVMSFSIKEMDMFLEDLAAFRCKYPEFGQNVFGLVDSELWESMARGELKDSQFDMELSEVNKMTTNDCDGEVEQYCAPGCSKYTQPVHLEVTDRSSLTPDSGRGSSISPFDQQVSLTAVPQAFPLIVEPVARHPNQQAADMTGLKALTTAAEIVVKTYTDLNQL